MIRPVVVPGNEDAAREAAERIAESVREALADRGAAHISLAGGTTPRRAYELLGPLLDDPARVDVWFGDERAVPPDDPDSNYRLVAESLLPAAPAVRVHRIEGERPAAEAAEAYEAELRRLVPANAGGVPVLDVALLGLGEDGHTASLFPGDPVLDLHGPLCVAVRAVKPPPVRITLTLDVLRAARRRILLATGAGKAGAVHAILAGPDKAYPASLLGATELIVDEAAASRLGSAGRSLGG